MTINRNGYVIVRAKGHPNADRYGRVREHILVAAKALGRPIPQGADVHHVNGNRADNRPENLVICESRAFHFLLHNRARALRECGHVDWRRCEHCLQYGPPTEVLPRKNGRHFNLARHLACARISDRARWPKRAAARRARQARLASQPSR